MNNSQEAALVYCKRGWKPVPVRARDKAPIGEAWQKLRLTEADIPNYFHNDLNVGVLLGEPSDGLVDIDLDAPEAVALADDFLPHTGSIFGRAGKAGSHRLFVVDPSPKTEKFQSNFDGDEKSTMLVELRSTGGQTVFPPSTHPTGEAIQWERDDTPAIVDGRELRFQVARLAAAALLVRYWPGVNGSRQDIALALAGGLLRAGWAEEEVADFIGVVAEAAGDEEYAKRAKAAEHTDRRLAQDGEATGWPKLAELMGSDVVTVVCKWLGVQQGWKGSRQEVATDARAAASADPGLRKRLADAITRTDNFAQDAGGRLYAYVGGFYQPAGEKFICRQVKELLNEWGTTKYWSTHEAEQVVEYIRIDAPTLWELPSLDTINVLNGLLDVSTGKLLPHTPDFLSPVRIPITYDPAARCPIWEKFVGETFPADAVAVGVPWEIVAWLITPCTSPQKSILLLGEGANGKSTFLAALTAVLGRQNVVNLSVHKLETDRFAAARLVGKLANICPDLPSTHLSSTSTFKALTGGDRIAAECKYRDGFDFVPYARLIFSANDPPHSDDATHAFFRRWVVIPFDRTFEAEEQTPRSVLDARLAAPAELSGVLNKALSVLAGVRERGITEPASMRQAWSEFKRVTDPLSVWLDTHTTEHPEAKAVKQQLWGAYSKACEQAGRATMTQKAFSQALRRLRPRISDGQRTVGGRIEHVWLGIGLTAPDEEIASLLSRDSQDSPNCFGSVSRVGGVGEGEEGGSINEGKQPVKPVNPVSVMNRRIRGLPEDLVDL